LASPWLDSTTSEASFAFDQKASPERLTRGVVLYPFDLSLADWPERAKRAGINTIALHAAKRFDILHEFVRRDTGQAFLERCRQLDIEVEYELHAMGELLSRELYHKDPSLFRMDASGRRNIDANCNPLSKDALEIISERAVHWAGIFRPTTHRYFYWPDDGAAWCQSPEARHLSASEQALIVENAILRALRQHVDPKAELSHISYSHTLPPPKQVQPDEGIFLEFAPILRDYQFAIADRNAKTRKGSLVVPDPETNDGYLELLETNLQVFRKETAQVLEYWLDVSMFSSWLRPAKKLPWNEQVCRRDIQAYRKLGLRHISSFATYIDAEYIQMHGEVQPILDTYGAILAQE
jgi:hypothetical protein